MLKFLEKPLIIILILLALSCYLYFLQLDKLALTDPDETFYAQTAKEMFQKGEWLTPMLYGKPQFEKPILFYWLIEISYAVFGINEFAVRFPSALFGFLGLAGVYLLGRLLFNNRTGIFSAIVLATCLEYVVLSIGCVTDMVLFTLLLFGALFFLCAQVRQKSYFYLLSSAAFALATLTKGPIGLLLPGFIILIYLFIVKDFALFKKVSVLAGALTVFLLIAAPWYMIMYKIHGKEFIDAFFGFQNITRFTTPEHRIGSQVYYNIPIVLGGFFPWSVFLPLGFWYFFKKAFSDAKRRHYIFVLLWFAVIFIFFTISSTKLPTYIFPCFMSLALITGKMWDDLCLNAASGLPVKWFRASYYFLIAIVLLAFPGMYIFLNMRYPDVAGSALTAGSFFLFGIILSWAAFVRKKYMAVLFLIAYSVALLIYPINRLVLPGIEARETSKALAKEILKHYKDGEMIGCEDDYCRGIAFYTGKMPVMLANCSAISELLNSKKRVWLVVKEKNLTDDIAAGPEREKKVNILYRSGKKLLVTNRPLDRAGNPAL